MANAGGSGSGGSKDPVKVYIVPQTHPTLSPVKDVSPIQQGKTLPIEVGEALGYQTWAEHSKELNARRMAVAQQPLTPPQQPQSQSQKTVSTYVDLESNVHVVEDYSGQGGGRYDTVVSGPATQSGRGYSGSGFEKQREQLLKSQEVQKAIEAQKQTQTQAEALTKPQSQKTVEEILKRGEGQGPYGGTPAQLEPVSPVYGAGGVLRPSTPPPEIEIKSIRHADGREIPVALSQKQMAVLKGETPSFIPEPIQEKISAEYEASKAQWYESFGTKVHETGISISKFSTDIKEISQAFSKQYQEFTKELYKDKPAALSMVSKSTAGAIEFVGMIPATTEMILKTTKEDPLLMGEIGGVGAVEFGKGIIQQAKEDPLQLASDIIVTSVLFKGVSDVANVGVKTASTALESIKIKEPSYSVPGLMVKPEPQPYDIRDAMSKAAKEGKLKHEEIILPKEEMPYDLQPLPQLAKKLSMVKTRESYLPTKSEYMVEQLSKIEVVEKPIVLPELRNLDVAPKTTIKPRTSAPLVVPVVSSMERTEILPQTKSKPMTRTKTSVETLVKPAVKVQPETETSVIPAPRTRTRTSALPALKTAVEPKTEPMTATATETALLTRTRTSARTQILTDMGIKRRTPTKQEEDMFKIREQKPRKGAFWTRRVNPIMEPFEDIPIFKVTRKKKKHVSSKQLF